MQRLLIIPDSLLDEQDLAQTMEAISAAKMTVNICLTTSASERETRIKLSTALPIHHRTILIATVDEEKKADLDAVVDIAKRVTGFSKDDNKLIAVVKEPGSVEAEALDDATRGLEDFLRPCRLINIDPSPTKRHLQEMLHFCGIITHTDEAKSLPTPPSTSSSSSPSTKKSESLEFEPIQKYLTTLELELKKASCCSKKRIQVERAFWKQVLGYADRNFGGPVECIDEARTLFESRATPYPYKYVMKRYRLGFCCCYTETGSAKLMRALTGESAFLTDPKEKNSIPLQVIKRSSVTA